MEIRKDLTRWILILSLTMTSSLAPAGPASDARDLLNETRESARLTALSTLSEVFGEVIARAEPLGQMLLPLRSMQNEMLFRLDRVRGALDQEAIADVEAASLIRDDALFLQDLDEVLDASEERFLEVQNELRLSLIRFRSIQARQRLVAEVMEKIRLDLIEVCSKGIAVNVDSRQLPGIRIRAPEFQVSFSAKSDGSKTETQLGNGQESEGKDPGIYLFPIFDEMGKDGRDYNGAASVAVPLGLYAAFTQIGGMLALNAALAAGGVTVVIAVVLFAIQDSISRKKASEAADAMERVFWQRADAQVVAADMRQACQPTLRALKSIPEEVRLQIAGSSEAVTRFKRSEERSKKFFESLTEVTIARAQKIQKLKSDGLSNAAVTQALKESSEEANYRAFLSEEALLQLGEAVSLQITKTLVIASRNSSDFEKYSVDQIQRAEGIFSQVQQEIPRWRDRLWRLNRLRMEVSLESQQVGLTEALRREGLLRSKDVALSRRWQKIYALTVGKAFFGRKAPIEAAALSGLLNEVRAELKQRPSSTLLKLVERRSLSLLRVLQEIP